MNVATLLLQQVTLRPDAPAIIETSGGKDHVLTYAALDSKSAKVVALLRSLGLKKGQAALVLIPMSLDLYVTLVALFRIGVVAMFLDPSAGTEHIEGCCTLRPPDAFLGTSMAHLLRLKVPALRQIPIQISTGDLPIPGVTRLSRADQLPPETDICAVDPETIALLTFTSGSTGKPKGAGRSHGLLLAQHTALASSLNLVAGEIDLTAMPIFSLANLASGVTSLIPEGDLRKPALVRTEPIRNQITRFRPSRIVASPAFLTRLLEEKDSLSTFRQIYTGGAPVFPDLLDRLTGATVSDCQIVTVYGSTEAEPIAHKTYADVNEEERAAMASGKGLLVGYPVPEITLRILPDAWGKPIGTLTDAEFASYVLPAGSVGEIVVSGNHVLTSYWRGQGNAETKFRVGENLWHRTGDSGYVDTTGQLWLLGRCSAQIVDHHGTLYPFAVECAARQIAGVRNAAVVRYRDRRILLIEGRSTNLTALKQSLTWAKLDTIQIWDSLPMDRRHNAKIDYSALQRRLERELAG